jgi:hypothetical protein
MPQKRQIERARKDARAGKAPTTQAGTFVHEELPSAPRVIGTNRRCDLTGLK